MLMITAQICHHKYYFFAMIALLRKSHLEAITHTESADASEICLKPGFYFLVGNFIWYFQLINEYGFMVEQL